MGSLLKPEVTASVSSAGNFPLVRVMWIFNDDEMPGQNEVDYG